MAEPRRVAVISLSSTPDPGAWLTDFLPGVEVMPLSVDERALEAQLAATLPGTAREAWVAFEHVLMGHLCQRTVRVLEGLGVEIPQLVHPAAQVSPQAAVGRGALVAAGAVIAPGAIVGAHARVWERGVLGRGARLGEHSTVDAGCVLGDAATVGAHCWIRTGVSLERRTSVGDHCELHVPGVWQGSFAEGTLHLPGLDGPVRIHRFG